jgi:hypothetical protein
MRTMLSLSVFAMVVAGAPAAAQISSAASSSTVPRFRGYISVDGGYQGGTEDFGTRGTFTEFLEEGNFAAEHAVDPGPQFQGAGGVAVWRNVYAGVAVSRFGKRTPATVTGSVPHPFFFSRNRAIEGEATGLTREELALHLQARAVVPLSTRVTVAFFGGPSWFRVQQEVVGGIDYHQVFPFDTALFRSAVTTASRASQLGFHAGADGAFFFTRHLGVGGSLQFARADVDLPRDGADSITVKAGGVQTGVGVRFRF